MSRPVLACFASLLLCGCYHPVGPWVSVDAYRQPSGGEYLILPGDVLQVTVFQQEAMSARVKVRPDGRVALPLVNELVASGKSPAALAAELEGRLKDFVNKPSVRVSLEESRPLTISVLGEVVRAGSVTL